MRRLELRLLARTQRIDLEVRPQPNAIEARPDFGRIIDKWVEGERYRLSPAQESSLTDPGASLGMMAAPLRADRDQYAQDVDTYLRKAREALASREVWQMVRHPGSMLSIEVANNTDRNYTLVALSVKMRSSDAIGFGDRLRGLLQDSIPPMPKPPPPIRHSRPGSLIGQMMGLNSLHNFPSYTPSLSVIPLAGVRRPWEETSSQGQLHIDFDTFSIRPHDTWRVKKVPLIVLAAPGSRIVVEWQATATNVDGRITGSFEISVTESTLDSTRLHDSES
jgi:hypothetical protein